MTLVAANWIFLSKLIFIIFRKEYILKSSIPTKTYSIKLDLKTYELLEKTAYKRKLYKSNIAREALERYLASEKIFLLRKVRETLMTASFSRGLSHEKSIYALDRKIIELQNNGYKLYFVTHTFVAREKYHDGVTRYSTAYTALRPNAIWKMYEQFYVGLLKNLLGSHFNRKRALQPKVFACLDLPWTSYGRGYNLDTEKTPHVHAIYAVHPASRSL